MNTSPTSTLVSNHDDNFGERVTVAVLLCIISFLGIVGNALTIFSVVACRRLKTISNAFVVSLSLSDFLNCSINIPVQVAALTQRTDGTVFHFVCGVSAILNYLLITCSVSMLDLIAINRYILVTKSHRIYTFLYNKRNMVVTFSAVWISSAALLIALGPTGIVAYGYQKELSLCQLREESRVIDIICGLLFSVSLIIVSSCYTKIYIHVRKHLRQVAHIRLGPSRPTPSTSAPTNSSTNISNIVAVESNGKQTCEATPGRPDEKEESPVDETENRITMNMIIIVVCFFLCMTPTLVIVLVPRTQNAGLYTVIFLYSASCCNPIIYAWKHPVFRKVFKCIFKRRWADIEEPSPWLRAMLPR